MDSGNLATIYKQFPLEVLKKVIADILAKRVALCDKKRARMWEAYDQATKKGIPFSERQNLKPDAAHLDALDAEERHALKGFKVIPYEHWLEPGDYEMMKAIGFKMFLQITLHRAYVATTTA